MQELGIHIHEEWRGMTQPVGLVVEPIVLDRFGIFPETNIKVISDLQMRLEVLIESQRKGENKIYSVGNFKEFCKQVLNWEDGDLLPPEQYYSEQKLEEIFVHLEDYGEILKPDWIVPEINRDNTKKIQIMVQELETGMSFDQIIKSSDDKKIWEATPQQRFERLLKETGNPLGIIWNGISLRLVYAPSGESSGHITFPLEPMTSVDGRPMIGALEMLLGPDRLFEGGTSSLSLRNLMEHSRKEQNEVSERLSEQVLEALWILVRGFDEAEEKAKLSGHTILNDLPTRNPSHIYGGLITVLLRLVFLLYSEDEELMPKDTLYVQNYSLNGLASKLREDRIQFQNAMEDRVGAWASILSLFRLVFDGGGPYESYLPARHGELFDPVTYPFLEGRALDYDRNNELAKKIPLISDDVVEKILSKLLLLDGQVLSYRALDVEQIGSVYEGIMGFAVERTKGTSVGILYRPPKQKITITFVVNSEQLLLQPGNKRDQWLKELAGVDIKLPTKVKRALKEANNLTEVCQALDNKLSPHTPRGLLTGSLIVQPTAERRLSGSHYTPRTLTEPVIKETFRPFLESCKYIPTAKEILSLKVCDPAMGSGAFLVATCRFLGNLLVSAWERDGFPPEFDKSYDKDIYARRLISQRCLYGVDKNPFAVSLARLSLWLVTLSESLPFTFVDHALKCGDSLIGYSIKEIQEANREVQLGFFPELNEIQQQLSIERQEGFSKDNRNNISYDKKKKLLDKQIRDSEGLRQAGDIMIAAFFSKEKEKERAEKQKVYLAMLRDSEEGKGSLEPLNEIRNLLIEGERGIRPFHWDLEFPEVFGRQQKGFNIIIGNPPFAGNNTFVKSYPKNIHNWLKKIHTRSGGQCDLVAHFFRRSFNLLKKDGSIGLIATNTISQGDTRNSALTWICKNNGTIYSVNKNYRWPGISSVLISVVHITKKDYLGEKFINSRKVETVSAFLTPTKQHDSPKTLFRNSNNCFQGSKPYGKGFTFDDTQFADNETPGVPSPIKTYDDLIKNKKNLEVIFPYIGGEEISSNPEQSNHRYVIDFRDRSEEECKNNYPEVFEIVEKKVRPERQRKKKDGEFKLRQPLPQKWWIHGEKRPALFSAISSKKRVLVISQISKYTSFIFLQTNQVFAQTLYIFPLDLYSDFAVCQSNVHLIWVHFFESTLEDRHIYISSECFDNFPFPSFMFESESSNNSSFKFKKELDDLGKSFYNLRAKIMIESGLGITKIMNRFHNPKEVDSQIIELRILQQKLDNAVLKSYGWSDLISEQGFNLDSINININESMVIPEKIRNFIKSGYTFQSKSEHASSFDNQLQEFTTGKKELPWNYSWPVEIRETILARLIELNSKYYEKERSQGLHSKREKNMKAKINTKDFTSIKSTSEKAQLGLEI